MLQYRLVGFRSALVFRVFLLSTAVAAQLFSSVFNAPALAQEKPASDINNQERRLIELAQTTAAIAGGARFCRFDTDDIEEFISKADARIVLLARDDYQKVLGRLEFKNILAATSARPPAIGCEKLAIQFDTILRESR